MIISASYRTDIPAFYGEWFKNRLHAGYCMVLNPYSNKPYRVELARKHVHAFVFWTKNIAPFFPVLEIVSEQQYPFMVQYSINNYSQLLEGRVIDIQQSVENVGKLFSTYGKRCVVWRYDPIVVTNGMDINWHLENFSRIAKQLRGMVDEVVVSFVQFYNKTVRNISSGSLKKIKFIDPDLHTKKEALERLSVIAKKVEMKLSICTQPQLVSKTVSAASCIDLNRLSDIAGYKMRLKIKGNRPGCYCAESRDIGAYDTCPHGCVYCYAVNNHRCAYMKSKKHDSACDILI